MPPTPTITDRVYTIQRTLIDPDPNQPRTEFTAADIKTLATSLETDGQKEPCLVRPHPEKKGRYMLINGERRWRAAEIAGLKTLECRVETEKLDAGDLLILQAQLNTGKPLTPLEEARLCATLAGEPHNLKQAEIADRLGIPRTTVGDRIRMASLPKPWLRLIENGTLTPSHAATIQPWTAIPEKYHADIVRTALSRSEVKHSIEYEKRPPALQELENAIDSAVDELKLIRPLGGSGGGFNPNQYEGPVLERKGYYRGHAANRFAADPELWNPLLNAARREKAKKREKERKAGEPTERQAAAAQRALIKVPDEVTTEKFTGYAHDLAGRSGETKYGFVFYGTGPALRQAWQKGWLMPDGGEHGGSPMRLLKDAFDPETLMRTLDYEKVTCLEGTERYGGQGERFAFLTTTHKGAVDTAKQAAQAAWTARETTLLADLGKRLTAKMAKDEKYNISGTGCGELVKQLLTLGGDRENPYVWAFYYIARAMGIEMPPLRLDAYGWPARTPIVNALSSLNAFDAARILGGFLAYDQKEDPEDWVGKHLHTFLVEFKQYKLEWPNAATTTTDEAEVERAVETDTPRTRTERTRTKATRATRREKRATAGAEAIEEGED